MDNALEHIVVDGRSVPFHRFNTIVVGTGAAGLNAAVSLRKQGQADIAIVTDGVKLGTSRNTGSDKQTYYKLTTCGDLPDSVRSMAETLFQGGAMDGDIALAEAACSMKSFFHLVDIGVPFPHNAAGEYVGYKTDHDPAKRGASAGPLTSRYMTECLLREARALGIRIFDRHTLVEILTAEREGERHAVGAVTLDTADNDAPRHVVFSATNIVFATGGQADMYKTSVYPVSQSGATGVAFRAGVKGKNLTESQFGIGSTKFRWNLSGSYQQVLPRYVSTDADGDDAREFLDSYFSSPRKLLTAIFLKGYQWPFDPRKVEGEGSSLVDILVYHEMQFKNRRVFLDYRANPRAAERDGAFAPDLLDREVFEYLDNSGAIAATPIRRLEQMNPAAVELYRSHGIDLETELLEIAVCAQHNNGGLAANAWWESDVRHFFPVGEANGSHGVYRPGGSALNSGQGGGFRAAEYIAHKYADAPLAADALAAVCGKAIAAAVAYGAVAPAGGRPVCDVAAEREAVQRRMTAFGAHIRSRETAAAALAEAREQMQRLAGGVAVSSPARLRDLYKTRDLVVCHFVYLSAILDYMEQGGGSRGSYLVHDANGVKPAAILPDVFSFAIDSGALEKRIQEVAYGNGECVAAWRDVRPIPPDDSWFETVWRNYLSGEIYQ